MLELRCSASATSRIAVNGFRDLKRVELPDHPADDCIDHLRVVKSRLRPQSEQGTKAQARPRDRQRFKRSDQPGAREILRYKIVIV